MKDLKKLSSWVYQAQLGAKEWREQAWLDCEMFDGTQYTAAELDKLQDIGVDPKVINRTFPVIQLLLGLQSINRTDIIAKPRTSKDHQIGQAMTESIKFVSDNCSGSSIISDAWQNAIVPGFGCLKVANHSDPRKEQVYWKQKDWKTIWWDPYSLPWFEPATTRYVFEQVFMDMENLQALFPAKAKEIAEYYRELKSDDYEYSEIDDEDWYREEEVRMATFGGKYWLDRDRKRVRPVEMWYPEWEESFFVVMPNDMVIELKEDMPVQQQYQMIGESKKVVKANVQKMKVCTFLGDLELQHTSTPFQHDEYPHVPFIGYLDRFGHPYGVPRQIREQDKEVNLRRSMSLAMLKSARVVAESGVVDTKSQLQNIHDEANKIDSFVIVNPGQLQNIQITEASELAPAQQAILEQSENEIKEIAGVNNPSMGYDTRREMSGVAQDTQIGRSDIMQAKLFDNLGRSHKRLGELTQSSIKQYWTGEKVLRITDELTGRDKIMVLNQMSNDVGGPKILNNISQHRYDIVIAQTPHTDTVREQNLNLILEWIKRAPPETIPILFELGIELSNIPQKDKILEKLRPLLGIGPDADDMSLEDIIATIKQQQQDRIQQLNEAELESKINRNNASAQESMADAEAKRKEGNAKLAETVAKIKALRRGNVGGKGTE